MIVILKKNPEEKQLQNLMAWLKSLNITIHPSEGETHKVLGLVGDTSVVDIDLLRALDIVEDVKRVQEPYKNANRKFHEQDTVIPVGQTTVGGGSFSVIAGPRSMVAPQALTAVAIRHTCSSLSMLHGPAITENTFPPICVFPTGMTLSSS